MLGLFRFLWFPVFILFGFLPLTVLAQNFSNPSLEDTLLITSTPNGWSHVLFSDPASQALTAAQSFPDVCGLTGPILVSGVSGNPFSGNSFVSGLMAKPTPSSVYHEGIQQTVSGFNTLLQYQVCFYQAVVKQDNCLDTSGAWAVYMDNVFLGNSTVSISQLVFNSNALIWDFDTITFTPTSTSHTFKFLPIDDDSDINVSYTNLAGGLRMGIDSIYIVPVLECNAQVDLGPDTSICYGDSINLNISNFNNFNFTWSHGDTDSSTTINSAGTYWVQVDSSVCSYSDTIEIIYSQIIDLGNDTTLCMGDSIVLNASVTGGSYLWNDLSTNSTLTADTTGQFYVQVTQNGCLYSDSILVDYYTPPTLNLGNDTTLCMEDSVILDASVTGGSYLWNDLSTNPTLTADTTGQFYVQVTQNGCLYSDSVLVDYYTPPALNLGNDTTLCLGDSLYIDATAPMASYLWHDASTNSDITINQPDTVSIILTQNGCSYADTIVVDYYPLINQFLGNDTVFCMGDSIALGSNISANSYLWSNGSNDSATVFLTADTMWLQIDLNGCVFTDSIILTNYSIPSIDIGNDTTLCLGDSVVLDASVTGGSYLWSDLSTNPTLTADTTGQFYVQVTQNGCLYSDSVLVDYYTPPALNLGNDTTLCLGDSLYIDATTPMASYLWHNASTNPDITINQPDTASIILTQNGCSYVDTIVVDYYPLINQFLGNDTVFCMGDSITLGSNISANSYLWNNGSNDSATVFLTVDTMWLQIDLNGCVFTDSIILTNYSIPSIDIRNDTTLCLGNSVVLDASVTGGNYLWNDLSTNPTLTADTTGQFYVQVTQNGCLYSDSILVDYYTPPALNLGNDTTLCQGDSLYIDATTPMASYLWHDASTNPDITINQPDTASIILTQNGCSYVDTIVVDYYPLINQFLGNDTVFCMGDSITLGSNISANSYLWNNGSNDSATVFLTVDTMWLQIDLNGCVFTDSIILTNYSIPSIDIGNDTTLCLGDSVVLDASVTGGSYLWNDLSTNPTLTADTTGQFYVQVTQNGCLYSDSILVGYYTPPVLNLGNDTTLCLGDSLYIDATTPMASYLWHDASTNPDITINQPDTVSIVLTQNGCSYTDTIVIDVLTPQFPFLGADTSLCPGDSLILNVNTTANILWSDGSVGSSLNILSGGIYWVELNDNGCITSDTVNVAYFSPPILDLGPDTSLCGSDSITWNVFQPNAGYLWHNNSSNSVFTAFNGGLFYVTLTDSNTCQISDTINVSELNLNLDLGSDLVLCDGDTIYLDVSQSSPAQYLWHDNSTLQNFSVSSSGLFHVTITSGHCEVSDTIEIDYIHIEPEFSVSSPHCTFERINFNNQTTISSNDSIQEYYWEFGNDDFSILKSPEYIYKQTGIFDVSLTVTSFYGCKKTLTENNFLTIHEKPNATFIYELADPEAFELEYNFISTSSDANTWSWYINDIHVSSSESVTHQFDNAGGFQKIELVIATDQLCYDFRIYKA